jgi:hypothetical protein
MLSQRLVGLSTLSTSAVLVNQKSKSKNVPFLMATGHFPLLCESALRTVSPSLDWVIESMFLTVCAVLDPTSGAISGTNCPVTFPTNSNLCCGLPSGLAGIGQNRCQSGDTVACPNFKCVVAISKAQRSKRRISD